MGRNVPCGDITTGENTGQVWSRLQTDSAFFCAYGLWGIGLIRINNFTLKPHIDTILCDYTFPTEVILDDPSLFAFVAVFLFSNPNTLLSAQNHPHGCGHSGKVTVPSHGSTKGTVATPIITIHSKYSNKMLFSKMPPLKIQFHLIC